MAWELGESLGWVSRRCVLRTTALDVEPWSCDQLHTSCAQIRSSALEHRVFVQGYFDHKTYNRLFPATAEVPHPRKVNSPSLLRTSLPSTQTPHDMPPRAATRCLLPQWAHHTLPPRPHKPLAPLSSSSRRSSSYSHLLTELPARRLPLIYDDLVPGSSHRLAISLSSFLPNAWVPARLAAGDLAPPAPAAAEPLPPAHHLVYFNPVHPAERLLPDGTDPLQSPGPPFVRRMWAGGSLRLNGEARLVMDGGRYVCMEGIRDVSVKGKEGQEKVFVGIERRVGRADGGRSDEEEVRQRLWTQKAEEFGDALLVERRNIVFMHERTPTELEAVKEALREGAKGQKPAKMLMRMWTLCARPMFSSFRPATCRALPSQTRTSS